MKIIDRTNLGCASAVRNGAGLRIFHDNFCAKLSIDFLGFDILSTQSKKQETVMAKFRENGNLSSGYTVKIPAATAANPYRSSAFRECIRKEIVP